MTKVRAGLVLVACKHCRENLEKVVEFPALKTAEPRFAIAENSDTGPMSEILSK